MTLLSHLKPLKIRQLILLFGIPTIWFLLITGYVTPWMTLEAGFHPSLSWFITGLLIFPLLFILAIGLTWIDGYRNPAAIFNRLRLLPMTFRDWKFTFVALLAILLLMGVIMGISRLLHHWFGLPVIDTSPSFISSVVLSGNERLYLLVWFIMFFFNIFGEELLWRGYILPRMETVYRQKAWLINALLWALFHLCFGPGLIILLLPILFILPYAVQRTQNTWVGILIHTLLNGPMFILLSLGIV